MMRCWHAYGSTSGLRWACTVVIFSLLSLTIPPAVFGQTKSGKSAPGSQSKKDQDEELQIPPRQSLILSTRDGVTLFVQYYPGGYIKTPQEVKKIEPKQVVPLILIHDWNGRGADFAELAAGLQQYGYAVAVPDLRGHGQSTVMRTVAGPVTLDVSQMNNREINALLAGMIEDIDTVKAHLLGENNKGQLNIELLGVIGAGTGTLVAMNWAVHDWNKQSLPAYKQGKDVKALVLLSPIESFRSMNNRAALSHPVVSQLPMLIAFGTGNRQVEQAAEKLYRFLEKRHQNPEETLRYLPVDVNLQGSQLLQRGTPVAAEVLRFVYKQLNEKAKVWPWTDRSLPLAQ